MISHNVITAIMAILMLSAVAFGYAPLLSRNLRKWAFWACIGVCGLAIVTVLRQSYWDLLQFATGDAWADIRTFLGGQKFSSVFNVGVMCSCWCLLYGRLHLIPAKDRWRWRWWYAWLHPCEKCVFWKRAERDEK